MGNREQLAGLLLSGLLLTAVACTRATPAAIRATSPTTSPSPSPSPTLMPNLVGRTGIQALHKIDSLLSGSLLYNRPTLIERDSHKTPGSVVGQKPPAGTDMTEPLPVTFVLARLFPRVPSVVGVSLAHAKTLLRGERFTISVRFLTTSGPTGIVVSQKPASGAQVHTRAIVTIATRICTPGYSPCLLKRPYGANYNCYGGDGSLPWTAPGVTYTVNPNKDIYGLDADGDGQGCEQG